MWIDETEHESKILYPKSKFSFTINNNIRLKIGNANSIGFDIEGVHFYISKRAEIVDKIIRWEKNSMGGYDLIIDDWVLFNVLRDKK